MKSLLLLRPTVLAIKNRWRTGVDMRAQAGRDIFLVTFSFLVMLAVFLFTSWALREANQNPTLAVLPQSMLLGVVFAMLLAMLLLSSVLAALGTFYLADDLELVLPTPLAWWKIFAGKFLYVFLISSWMPFLFASPMLLAFGIAAHAGWEYFVLTPLLMIPYLLIPSALGVIVATLLVLVVPVYRVRETILVIFVALAAVGYIIIDALSIEWNSLRSAQELLRVMSLVTAPSVAWLPSNWLGMSLGELLAPQQAPLVWYALTLVSVAVAVSAGAYAFTLAAHHSAYSNIRNKRQGAAYGSRTSQRRLRRFGGMLNPAFRALIGKELRVLSRDVSQVVQLFMLIALSLIYLYHMRLFSAVESFPDAIRPWWRNFLFIGNITMGAFIITALCTRFVVPSLSLEGRSFWILQTAPIDLGRVVRMKFLSWLVPTSLVAILFFSAGATAIGAETHIVLLCALSSIVISYGVVGLAIGFGARFAYFEWEHSSQLAGSVGSLLFMLAATTLIFINMIPAWLLLAYGPQMNLSRDGAVLTISLGALVLLVIGINVQAARLAMAGGVASLLKRYQ